MPSIVNINLVIFEMFTKKIIGNLVLILSATLVAAMSVNVFVCFGCQGCGGCWCYRGIKTVGVAV